jgi:hypothetical protein
MRNVLLAASAAVALVAGAAMADPLDDAKAGLSALDKGDNPAAIKLFSSALESGKLTRSDQELAHVKRSEAYLANSEARSALDDADAALNLDPADSEATAARNRAQALLTPPAPPTPTAADNARADYVAAVAKYEAEKQADADSYAKRMSDYDAQVKAQTAKHDADVAQWQSDYAACKAGDQTKCATTAATPPAQAALPAKPTQTVQPKPVETAQAAPKTAPKAVKPGAQQAATKPVKKTEGPLEKQIIY